MSMRHTHLPMALLFVLGLRIATVVAEDTAPPVGVTSSTLRPGGGAPGEPPHAVKPERTGGDQTQLADSACGFRGWVPDVWAPIARLAGIALIFGLLIRCLDLPAVLRPESWSERTILAFAVIFTYCAAALMGAARELAILKDVALLTLGFYFGSSKGGREAVAASGPSADPPPTRKPTEPAARPAGV